MTTYLATIEIQERTTTMAYCSEECREYRWPRGARIMKFCDDDSYEFDETCANCGKLVPASGISRRMSDRARDSIEAQKRYYEWLPAPERRKINCVMAMEYALEMIDKHGSAPVPAPRLECPTNHMWLNHNVPGAAEWEPWAAKGYNYCPDCGTALSPPVGTQE